MNKIRTVSFKDTFEIDIDGSDFNLHYTYDPGERETRMEPGCDPYDKCSRYKWKYGISRCSIIYRCEYGLWLDVWTNFRNFKWINMNWNSKTKQWTDLKSLAVIKLATIATKLRSKSMSIKNIAEVLDKSESRIKEYLK